MQLINKELLNNFKKIGQQESSEDPEIICKFFNPMGAGTWLCISITDLYIKGERVELCNVDIKALNLDDITEINFFGWADLGDIEMAELGYFSLNELKRIKIMGLGIERDLYTHDKKLSYYTK